MGYDDAGVGMSKMRELLLEVFDDPATSAKLQASIALIFKVESKHDLDRIVELCRLIYVMGALNACNVATGQPIDEIAEQLGETWDSLFWIHLPGGNA